MKRTIRKVRQENNRGLSIPNSRQDIVFSEGYTKTTKGEEFLLYDSSANEERVLIFSTRKNLSVLNSCSSVFMDGTFKTVPNVFGQLYTIHGLKNGFCMPLIFCLLPNKKADTYVKFLCYVQTLTPFSNTKSITTDYELAMIKAIRAEFDDVNHYGCFFLPRAVPLQKSMLFLV